MKFWESWLLSNKSFSMSPDFCLKRKDVWLFRKKLTLRWLCIFAYQEEPPSSLLSTSLELNCLKNPLKEVLGYLSFFLEHPNSVSHKEKPHYLHPSRWVFQAHMFWRFPLLLLLMLLVGVFDHQCKVSVTLIIALPQEESCISVLISVLREIFWCSI